MNNENRSYSLVKIYLIILAVTWLYAVFLGIVIASLGRGGEAGGITLIFAIPVWLFCSLGAVGHGVRLLRQEANENHRKFGKIAIFIGMLSLLGPFVITFGGMLIITLQRM
ncbi:MAG TPA: hypothetical protein PK096_03235 [Candidatus Saccharibacteria bacterium]|nr:hypothetical protein [Candidatus Saccharibacteria bacterium]HRK94356.1 hypothetical protein [Candidatus Saccharibacteria bacterium]